MLTGYHGGSLAEGIYPSQVRGLWETSAQRILALRKDSEVSLVLVGKGGSPSLSLGGASIYTNSTKPYGNHVGRLLYPSFGFLGSFLGCGSSHTLLSPLSHTPFSSPTIFPVFPGEGPLDLRCNSMVFPQGFFL